MTRWAAARLLWREQGFSLLPFLFCGANLQEGRAGRRGRLLPQKRGLPRAAMDGRAWRRSVKRCSAAPRSRATSEASPPGRQKLLRVFVPRGACAVPREAPHHALRCARAGQCPRGTRGGRSPPFPPSLSGILRFSFFPSERRLFFCPGGGAWWVSRLGGGTTRRLRREDGLSMPSANVPSACPSGRKTPSERRRRVRP